MLDSDFFQRTQNFQFLKKNRISVFRDGVFSRNIKNIFFGKKWKKLWIELEKISKKYFAEKALHRAREKNVKKMCHETSHRASEKIKKLYFSEKSLDRA